MGQLNARGIALAAEIAATPEIVAAAKAPMIETTQNHYAYYASVINSCSAGVEVGQLKGMHFLTAEALIIAGANRQGVNSAMFSMFGYAEYDPMTRLLAG